MKWIHLNGEDIYTIGLVKVDYSFKRLIGFRRYYISCNNENVLYIVPWVKKKIKMYDLYILNKRHKMQSQCTSVLKGINFQFCVFGGKMAVMCMVL